MPEYLGREMPREMIDSFSDRLRSEIDRLVQLSPGEAVSYLWYGTAVESFWGKRMDSVHDGLLMATSQRLTYLSIEWGSHTAFFIPSSSGDPPTLGFWMELRYRDVEALAVKRTWSGYLSLSVGQRFRPAHGFTFSRLEELDKGSLQTDAAVEPHQIQDDLQQMIMRDLARKPGEEPKKEVDMASVRAKLAELGVKLESVRCPSCGGPLKAPALGSTISCPYCGSWVAAFKT